MPLAPIVPGQIADDREQGHPRHTAQRGQGREPSQGHARSPGRQRDEGAHERQDASHQDRAGSVPSEEPVGPGQVARRPRALDGRPGSAGRRTRPRRRSTTRPGCPITPAMTTATSPKRPWETPKPANSIVASDGIGMQALSSSIRTKIPTRPRLPITEVAASTRGPVREAKATIGYRSRSCSTEGRRSERRVSPPATATATHTHAGHPDQIAPRDRQRVRGGIEDPGQHVDQAHGQQGRDPGAEHQAPERHEERLAPDEASELARRGRRARSRSQMSAGAPGSRVRGPGPKRRPRARARSRVRSGSARRARPR